MSQIVYHIYSLKRIRTASLSPSECPQIDVNSEGISKVKFGLVSMQDDSGRQVKIYEGAHWADGRHAYSNAPLLFATTATSRRECYR